MVYYNHVNQELATYTWFTKPVSTWLSTRVLVAVWTYFNLIRLSKQLPHIKIILYNNNN